MFSEEAIMPVAVNDLKTMTVPELKKLLMEYKLNVSGKKQDLITRLTEYLNAPTEKAAPEPEKEIQSEQPKVKPATKTTALPQQAKDSTKENVIYMCIFDNNSSFYR